MIYVLLSTLQFLNSKDSLQSSVFFFFNDTATTEIYTLSLHDALPIYLQVRGNRADAPIFVLHLCLDVHAVRALVQGVHQRAISLPNVAAPHLARARQLAVVGVELLVQDEEAADLGVGDLGLGRQVGVDAL